MRMYDKMDTTNGPTPQEMADFMKLYTDVPLAVQTVLKALCVNTYASMATMACAAVVLVVGIAWYTKMLTTKQSLIYGSISVAVLLAVSFGLYKYTRSKIDGAKDMIRDDIDKLWDDLARRGGGITP